MTDIANPDFVMEEHVRAVECLAAAGGSTGIVDCQREHLPGSGWQFWSRRLLRFKAVAADRIMRLDCGIIGTIGSET
ncbi:hypothetical protein [Sinorhizobium americanum]|uniref:hypothetical protein n=1 Tax=Sinorhizobium americanum TaxID=194963 RepID=UPI0010506586|nr:hypothetical protein [Sinorhizobium americanum]